MGQNVEGSRDWLMSISLRIRIVLIFGPREMNTNTNTEIRIHFFTFEGIHRIRIYFLFCHRICEYEYTDYPPRDMDLRPLGAYTP